MGSYTVHFGSTLLHGADHFGSPWQPDGAHRRKRRRSDERRVNRSGQDRVGRKERTTESKRKETKRLPDENVEKGRGIGANG